MTEEMPLLVMDSDSDDDVGEEDEYGQIHKKSLLQRIEKRSRKREKRRQRLKKTSMEQEILKAKKIAMLKHETLDDKIDKRLRAEFGPGVCLACRTARCRCGLYQQ
jgi:hypothetical protein